MPAKCNGTTLPFYYQISKLRTGQYVHFIAMDISEMDISKMTSSNVSISDMSVSIYQSFYPLPYKNHFFFFFYSLHLCTTCFYEAPFNRERERERLFGTIQGTMLGPSCLIFLLCKNLTSFFVWQFLHQLFKLYLDPFEMVYLIMTAKVCGKNCTNLIDVNINTFMQCLLLQKH